MVEKTTSQELPRPYSSKVVDGADRAASRAMLHAIGFEREDFQKPQIGVASTWSQVTPCNVHIDRLARETAKGIEAAGGKGLAAIAYAAANALATSVSTTRSWFR